MIVRSFRSKPASSCTVGTTFSSSMLALMLSIPGWQVLDLMLKASTTAQCSCEICTAADQLSSERKNAGMEKFK